MSVRIPRAVTKWKAKPFLIKDRLPNQAVPPIAPVGNTPQNMAPRVQPMTGQRNYGKTQQSTGFGTTGLTGET